MIKGINVRLAKGDFFYLRVLVLKRRYGFLARMPVDVNIYTRDGF